MPQSISALNRCLLEELCPGRCGEIHDVSLSSGVRVTRAGVSHVVCECVCARMCVCARACMYECVCLTCFLCVFMTAFLSSGKSPVQFPAGIDFMNV